MVSHMAQANVKEFCQVRCLSENALSVFEVELGKVAGRTGLIYPTPIGVKRVKFLDDARPKYRWIGTGGRAHWYGLRQAGAVGGETLWIVNGEPSVWACAQSQVPAVCLCTGEGSLPGDQLIEELRRTAFIRVVVVFDRDAAGEHGARRLVSRLVAVGVHAEARTLPETLGLGADVDDLHRKVGDSGLALALESLPQLGHNRFEATPVGWPELPTEARHGLPGRIVNFIEPHSEADPAAILVQLLVAAGSAIGRGPFFEVEADRHHTNLFAIIVGSSSKARKGTSWAHVRQLLKIADEEWEQRRVLSGLSSGEGLAAALRDGQGDEPEGPFSSPTGDKRLLAFEGEFASVLRMADRKGNTLSAQLRQAWDGSELGIMTRNDPVRATGVHVSIVGHITADELRRCLSTTEASNGFGNRFLWVLARRSKLLPDGGRPDEFEQHRLAFCLRDALNFAKSVGRVRRSPRAQDLWRAVYETLSEAEPGLAGALTSRGEAQVARLSLVYALLDNSSEIRPEHLAAAIALWQYCLESARHLAPSRVPESLAEKIRNWVSEKPEGASKTEIHRLAGGRLTGEEIDTAVSELHAQGLVVVEKRGSGGRPSEVVVPVAVPPSTTPVPSEAQEVLSSSVISPRNGRPSSPLEVCRAWLAAERDQVVRHSASVDHSSQNEESTSADDFDKIPSEAA